MISTSELEDALRASARGLFSMEAAVELLVRHDRWLQRDDFREHISVGPSLDDPSELWACVEWTTAIVAQLACSSSERCMLELAAGLAGIQPPTALGSLLGSLDDYNLRIALAAITHAARGREAADWDELDHAAGRPR